MRIRTVVGAVLGVGDILLLVCLGASYTPDAWISPIPVLNQAPELARLFISTFIGAIGIAAVSLMANRQGVMIEGPAQQVFMVSCDVFWLLVITLAMDRGYYEMWFGLPQWIAMGVIAVGKVIDFYGTLKGSGRSLYLLNPEPATLQR